MLSQETVADELEEAYRNHIWNPAQRHVKEHKSGVTAARVELTTLHTKVDLFSRDTYRPFGPASCLIQLQL